MTVEDAPAILDPKSALADMLAVRARGASLSSEIETAARLATEKLAEIEQRRGDADKAKSNIDAEVIAAHEQAERAKAIVAELSVALATIQNSAVQAAEASIQAIAGIETIRMNVSVSVEAASRTEAMKVQVEQNAQVVAQRSQHVEDGRQYVDAKRVDIDILLNRVLQAATSTEAHHQAARSTSDILNALLLAAQTTKANVDLTAEAIANIRRQCDEHAATAKTLADVAVSTEAKIRAYESRLTELEALANTRLKTIESLLPGATSAGLASAFGQRRGHYKWPQRIWQGVFILSVLALLGLAYEFPAMAKDVPLSWERLGASLVYRLPFALPLIWLAFHSSHKAALAQRVEEDYAFKETVSRSFEGYRREMAQLDGKVDPDSPLARLCADTLAIIARRPGLIYEKHPLTRTPLNALAESVGPLADAAAKFPPAKVLGSIVS